MNSFNNICMNCMKPMEEGALCPHCGFDNTNLQTYPYLPCQTVLAGRYLIGRLLERSSDSVVYMAFDLSQKAPITIREFLPQNLTNRIAGNPCVLLNPGKTKDYQECLNSFLDLWRSLAKMRQLSAIVPVYDIFEENNTAYAVSEYMEHITLRDYLLRQPEGYLPWEKARVLLMPLLSTLMALHNNGIIHRAISPTNLIICKKDTKLRLDHFSIWQANSQNTCLTFEEQPGYTALEQYSNDYQQGPWTDIYSFTATLYRTLVGNNPIDAQTRSINDKLMIPAKFAEQIPAYVINAMGNALQIYPNDRTRTVERLRSQLSAAPSETVGNTSRYEKVTPPPVPRREEAIVTSVYEDANYEDWQEEEDVRRDLDQIKKRQKTTTILSIIAALIVIIGVGVGVFLGTRNKEPDEGEATQTAEMVAVPNFCLGYSQSEIQNNSTYNTNFQIEFIMEYSDTVEQGQIMDQSLPAGSSTAKGSKITLTVSKGIEKVLMQNFVGMTLEEAEEALKDSGFLIETVTKQNDGSHDEGDIYSQSLESGKSYEKGSTVLFQVWGAPETEPETKEPTTEEEESSTRFSFVRPSQES